MRFFYILVNAMDVVEGVFAVGDVINFSVFQPAILGTKFYNVKVLAVLDADTAKLMGVDTIALHAALYTYFEPESNKTLYKKHTDYLYIKIQMPNGTVTAIGLPWMDMATVQVVTPSTKRFTIVLNNAGDEAQILQLLNANGWHNIMVESV